MIKALSLNLVTILTNVIIGCSAQTVFAQEESEIQLFPDWNQISLLDLGGIGQDGEIGTEYNQAAGYDISRQWNTGDTPDRILKLGDLESHLAPQEFSLEQITNLTKSTTTGRPAALPLSEFSLVGKQTIEDLVEAVPDLGLKRVMDVQPIADLLEQKGYDYQAKNTKLEALIKNKAIAKLELDSLNLDQYTVEDIPNLEQAQLKNFTDYKDSFISEIPGLDEVPLGNYPNEIAPSGSLVARIDFVWGDAESDRNRTISGSYVAGFSVDCDSNCEYLELDDLENVGTSVQLPFEGQQWIAGREHWVAGGTGCFSGGREPTGIHPFGPTFKVVLWSTAESSDSAEIMMYFNYKTQCGESPYFIGPIPFPMGHVKINDWVFIGSEGV
jgi:hypothetical protein